MNDYDCSWLKRVQKISEELPVRQDMVTLLGYLQSTRVKGTKSLGNLPLMAVREITALFVNPPVLDKYIGERVYKVRSEDEVWPLVFLHACAEAGELLMGDRSRLFRVTPMGDRFLSFSPFEQVKYMILTWWTRVNWLIAYPYEVMGDDLPHNFHFITLESLLGEKDGKQVKFEPFADKLIEETGLSWTSEYPGSYRSTLISSIEKMVFDVLIDFRVLEVGYHEEVKYSVVNKKINTFQITDFGEDLLTMVYYNF